MSWLKIKTGAAALTLSVAFLAAETPTTAPTEPPATLVTAPTPAPASTRQLVVAPVGPTYSSVLVLPFSPVSGASEWIGRGIQEDLATDLVRQTRLSVLTPPDAPATADALTAAKTGHDRNTSLVAFGTYQTVGDNLRIDGQLVDTKTGDVVAALKATGARRDLFHLEDVLAAQATASLPRTLLKSSVALDNAGPTYNSQGFYTTPGPEIVPETEPLLVNPPSAYLPDPNAQYPLYDQYAYPSDIPSFGYPYSYGPGLFWYGGFGGGFGGRYHGGGYHGGGYHGGGYHGGEGTHSFGGGYHGGGRR